MGNPFNIFRRSSRSILGHVRKNIVSITISVSALAIAILALRAVGNITPEQMRHLDPSDRAVIHKVQVEVSHANHEGGNAMAKISQELQIGGREIKQGSQRLTEVQNLLSHGSLTEPQFKSAENKLVLAFENFQIAQEHGIPTGHYISSVQKELLDEFDQLLNL